MKNIIELLSTYSLDEVVIIIIMLALSIKGIIDFIDWVKKRKKAMMDKNYCEITDQKSMKENIDRLFEMQVNQKKAIDSLTKSVDLLIQSDKDDIKAWITEKHHYYCYELKYIDDFSLDCIERRYAHYQREGGNSFVEDLMKDLRSLKKVSSSLVRQIEQPHHEDNKEN